VVKKEAMRVAGRILSRPRLYRAAVQAAAAGIDHLPRFMIYNPFNAWGKQRELPATPPQTFRQWYMKHRSAKAES
jgi:L-lactate dehydrogenase complex protein LldF